MVAQRVNEGSANETGVGYEGVHSPSLDGDVCEELAEKNKGEL
jgi:hypothetical protein